MSDQKPKIDLKARLGKKPASSPMAGPSSTPPTAGPGVGPAPAGPQPGYAPPSAAGYSAPAAARPNMPRPSGGPQSGGIPIPAAGPGPSGIPAPPFGGTSRPAASNPYAGMEVPAAAPARPQAIRIEMGEEVVQAQRAGRKKVLILSLVTALIGGVVGFTAGGGAERAKGADSAIQGAQDLVKEIDAANVEVQKLADTLKSAKEKLSKGQFPEEEVSKLGAINIPFGGKNLAGKGIGRFKPEVITMLIDYANKSAEANEQKEKLQNVLGGAKVGIVELLQQGDKSPVRWSVLVANGPGGPWASMVSVPAPFGMKEKWPEELKVGSGKQQASFKRYTSGNVVNDQSPFFLPVDPTSQGAVCPQDVIFKLRRELNDLETLLRGDNSPNEEHPGLINAAQKLNERLKQIGKNA